jgi:hypothetical protein
LETERPAEEDFARNSGLTDGKRESDEGSSERCAGIDVAKKVLNVCAMTGPADAEPTVELRLFGSFNAELNKLREWLIETECTHVVMESTGSYWKPVYAVLEESGIKVLVVNGEDVKARRGHKTDWNDCQLRLVAPLNRASPARPSRAIPTEGGAARVQFQTWLVSLSCYGQA